VVKSGKSDHTDSPPPPPLSIPTIGLKAGPSRKQFKHGKEDHGEKQFV
jgi:hypothetical protein